MEDCRQATAGCCFGYWRFAPVVTAAPATRPRLGCAENPSPPGSAPSGALSSIRGELLVLAPGPIAPLATMIVAGVGNALFHLGAGGLVLRSAGGRATPAGVFVAPGALGLGLGMWMGRTGRGSTFPIYVALAFAVIALITLDKPALKWEPSKGSHALPRSGSGGQSPPSPTRSWEP